MAADQHWPYPRPAVAVDLVIFTILDADLKVLLIDREVEPFVGQPALPGGFVRVGEDAGDQGEDLDEAVLRELEEETGLPRGSVFFDQLRTYGGAGRDPRMRVFSIAHVALVRPDLAGLAAAGGDARNARAGSRSDTSAPRPCPSTTTASSTTPSPTFSPRWTGPASPSSWSRRRSP